ncbi:MAG TPA: biotin/lipoyl-containing protein [Pyrinomonadaceae bacterium]|jgi:biotin carboxyl carrier protein|nr:biotin/lipoyl-containing protein [Pyrinomonadaceae bacterium]
MKLRATVSDKEHEIALKLAGDKASVEIDGRHYEVEIRELAPGQYLLMNGTKVSQCRVERGGNAPGVTASFEITVRGRNCKVDIIDPKRLRSGQSLAAHHTGAAQIVSPMPGKIVRLLVAAGDNIEAGAGVIVVEAMKMQNEMKAPKAGTVVSINAAEGAAVNAGDVLAVIE